MISFADQDAAGLDTSHRDPLVVSLQIHDSDVSRILVDTGSSVNLIFKETLDRLGIDEEYIKQAPAHRIHCRTHLQSRHDSPTHTCWRNNQNS
ncbi:unnamed protein product [Microthlaspi erraticum]|uniref:Uncharacterized protein n=1 Tax=Microthlaspi erraticum TaxID=1685480 RepID=A0A6D2I6U7_9BRAS|nr:unnamed protein product [Microthlaspi erraticum]